jgi:hypothetical protein
MKNKIVYKSFSKSDENFCLNLFKNGKIQNSSSKFFPFKKQERTSQFLIEKFVPQSLNEKFIPVQERGSSLASGSDEGLFSSFLNFSFDKGRLKGFVIWFLKTYGQHKTVLLLEKLKEIGFHYATRAGISLGIDDLRIPPQKTNLLIIAQQKTIQNKVQYKKGQITDVEYIQKFIDIWHQTSENLKKEVVRNFEVTDPLNPVYMMAFSGARGNISQVRQLVGMRGLMADPQGQIIDFPIRSNFREGLTLTEYIISTYGARKGIVDTALRTANAGYLTRRLVDVAQHVVVSEFDCHTKKGVFIFDMKEGVKTIYPLKNRLIGRVLAKDVFSLPSSTGENIQKETKSSSSPFVHKKNTQTVDLSQQKRIAYRNQEISIDLAETLIQISKKILIRSPLTCETQKSVCQLCYGWSLATNRLVSIGEVVGVIAAQSIGEPGTQLTMRTFHTGGVFSGGMSDQLIAQNEAIVEYAGPIAGTCVRTPQGEIAFLTKSEGSLILKNCVPSEGRSYSPDKKPESKIENFDPYSKTRFTFPLSQKEQGEKNKIQSIQVFKVPSFSLLFARNGQKVVKKQLIAQLNLGASRMNQRGVAEQTVYSEYDGELYNSQVDIIERFNEYQDLNSKSLGWGYIWILSGKIYKTPLESNQFPRPGDFIAKKSPFSRIGWVSSESCFLQTTKNQQKEFQSNVPLSDENNHAPGQNFIPYQTSTSYKTKNRKSFFAKENATGFSKFSPHFLRTGKIQRNSKLLDSFSFGKKQASYVQKQKGSITRTPCPLFLKKHFEKICTFKNNVKQKSSKRFFQNPNFAYFKSRNQVQNLNRRTLRIFSLKYKNKILTRSNIQKKVFSNLKTLSTRVKFPFSSQNLTQMNSLKFTKMYKTHSIRNIQMNMPIYENHSLKLTLRKEKPKNESFYNMKSKIYPIQKFSRQPKIYKKYFTNSIFFSHPGNPLNNDQKNKSSIKKGHGKNKKLKKKENRVIRSKLLVINKKAKQKIQNFQNHQKRSFYMNYVFTFYNKKTIQSQIPLHFYGFLANAHRPFKSFLSSNSIQIYSPYKEPILPCLVRSRNKHVSLVNGLKANSNFFTLKEQENSFYNLYRRALKNKVPNFKSERLSLLQISQILYNETEEATSEILLNQIRKSLLRSFLLPSASPAVPEIEIKNSKRYLSSLFSSGKKPIVLSFMRFRSLSNYSKVENSISAKNLKLNWSNFYENIRQYNNQYNHRRENKKMSKHQNLKYFRSLSLKKHILSLKFSNMRFQKNVYNFRLNMNPNQPNKVISDFCLYSSKTQAGLEFSENLSSLHPIIFNKEKTDHSQVQKAKRLNNLNTFRQNTYYWKPNEQLALKWLPQNAQFHNSGMFFLSNPPIYSNSLTHFTQRNQILNSISTSDLKETDLNRVPYKEDLLFPKRTKMDFLVNFHFLKKISTSSLQVCVKLNQSFLPKITKLRMASSFKINDWPNLFSEKTPYNPTTFSPFEKNGRQFLTRLKPLYSFNQNPQNLIIQHIQPIQENYKIYVQNRFVFRKNEPNLMKLRNLSQKHNQCFLYKKSEQKNQISVSFFKAILPYSGRGPSQHYTNLQNMSSPLSKARLNSRIKTKNTVYPFMTKQFLKVEKLILLNKMSSKQFLVSNVNSKLFSSQISIENREFCDLFPRKKQNSFHFFLFRNQNKMMFLSRPGQKTLYNNQSTNPLEIEKHLLKNNEIRLNFVQPLRKDARKFSNMTIQQVSLAHPYREFHSQLENSPSHSFISGESFAPYARGSHLTSKLSVHSYEIFSIPQENYQIIVNSKNTQFHPFASYMNKIKIKEENQNFLKSSYFSINSSKSFLNLVNRQGQQKFYNSKLTGIGQFLLNRKNNSLVTSSKPLATKKSSVDYSSLSSFKIQVLNKVKSQTNLQKFDQNLKIQILNQFKINTPSSSSLQAWKKPDLSKKESSIYCFFDQKSLFSHLVVKQVDQNLNLPHIISNSISENLLKFETPKTNVMNLKVEQGWVYVTRSSSIPNFGLHESVRFPGKTLIDDILFENNRVYMKYILLNSQSKQDRISKFPTPNFPQKGFLSDDPLWAGYLTKSGKDLLPLSKEKNKNSDPAQKEKDKNAPDFCVEEIIENKKCRFFPFSPQDSKKPLNFDISSNMSTSQFFPFEEITEKKQVALMILPMQHRILPNVHFYKRKIYRSQRNPIDPVFSNFMQKNYRSYLLNKQLSDKKLISTYPAPDLKLTSTFQIPKIQEKIENKNSLTSGFWNLKKQKKSNLLKKSKEKVPFLTSDKNDHVLSLLSSSSPKVNDQIEDENNDYQLRSQKNYEKMMDKLACVSRFETKERKMDFEYFDKNNYQNFETKYHSNLKTLQCHFTYVPMNFWSLQIEIIFPKNFEYTFNTIELGLNNSPSSPVPFSKIYSNLFPGPYFKKNPYAEKWPATYMFLNRLLKQSKAYLNLHSPPCVVKQIKSSIFSPETNVSSHKEFFSSHFKRSLKEHEKNFESNRSFVTPIDNNFKFKNQKLYNQYSLSLLNKISLKQNLNLYLKDEMAYFANQRFAAMLFTHENLLNKSKPNSRKVKQFLSHFPTFTNELILNNPSFGSIISNKKFAFTSFLSPYDGEFMPLTKNRWLKTSMEDEYLILSKSDLFSVSLNQENFESPNYRNLKQKLQKHYNLFLDNEKFANVQYNSPILKPKETLVNYEKKLYKVKGLQIGSFSPYQSLRIGSFILHGDVVSPGYAFNKTGQIIHISSEKVTIRRAQPISLSPGTLFHFYNGDFVKKNDAVVTLAFQTLKTGDIVQGIPKVEQYFEARTSRAGRLFRDSLPILLQGLFQRYSSFLPLKQAVRQSVLKIQQIIVDGVQRVYRSQGVGIVDKHLEIVVRQMTSKVQIINADETGFFPGELFDFEFIEYVNFVLGTKIKYEPVVLGITRASLEVESFLSAASFQQTTRILSKAAISRKKDFLKGLKENLITANLIPAGTGYFIYSSRFRKENIENFFEY